MLFDGMCMFLMSIYNRRLIDKNITPLFHSKGSIHYLCNEHMHSKA